MAQGGGSNKWRLQDLHDLEQYGLAAELESTKLGSSQSQSAMVFNEGAVPNVDISTYNMSEVLSGLLTEDNQLFPETILSLPSSLPPSLSTHPQAVSAVLRAPTAYCVKVNQPELTYMQKGFSYELHVNRHAEEQGVESVFRSVLLLTFSELRLRNCEDEQFEHWINDHPMERLLEMDNVGCAGVTGIENSEENLHTISFTWSSLTTAIVAFKVNCLSSEFAARRHGGEKGIPLCLQLDTYVREVKESSGETSERLVERLACNIKVFKDKGAERKQRQEQVKVEKMAPEEQVTFHKAQNVTTLRSVQITTDVSMAVKKQATPTTAATQTNDLGSPFQVTTPPRQPVLTSPDDKLDMCSTVEHAHTWLTRNRFGQFLSLFANYTSHDLLRLSRRDLVDLCGAADGIRLYNALRSHTVKVVYIAMGTEKICQAVCLEQLTAQELGVRVAEKLDIPPQSISTLVRLTPFGILVLLDDTVIRNIRDEECFLLQTIKQEDGRYQVILQDHTPSEQSLISIRGAEIRHS